MTNPSVRPRLLAIVAVSPDRRVFCQNPGCGHTVYAAIHIVEEGDQLLVLGSTCFAKRYGGLQALGNPAYSAGAGGTGSGAALTEEQRQILIDNTAAFIAQIRAEHERSKAQLEDRLRVLKERIPTLRAPRPVPAFQPRPAGPWPWQHTRNTSVALMRAPTGQYWVRVQHQDGRQMLAPWPQFEGWKTALPPECGLPDTALEAYSTPDIASALAAMRALGFEGPAIGLWAHVRPR